MSSDEKLDEILRRLGLMETGIANLGKRMDSLESRLSHVEQGVINLGARAEALENKTEPLLQSIDGKLTVMHTEMTASFNLLNKKIDVMNKEFLTVKAEQAQISDRVDDLERKAS